MHSATLLPPAGSSPGIAAACPPLPGPSITNPATAPGAKARVTQLDIARAAGVHNTTVSLALRNSPSIPAATRERIHALAEQLGYRPDPALRALVAYRNGLVGNRPTETIAYITNSETRGRWREITKEQQYFLGAQRKAAECGYHLEHFWLGEPGMTPHRLSDVLFHRGITGILLAPHRPGPAEALDLVWPRFSAVTVGHVPNAPAVHRVTSDPAGDVRLAVQHIRAAGYRRPGLILPQPGDDAVERALSVGFLTEQQRMSTEQRVPILFHPLPGPATREVHSRVEALIDQSNLAQWLDEFQPDVIIGAHPLLQGPLAALGIRIPADVALVDPHLEIASSDIAGIRQHHERIGEVAMEILVGQQQQNLRGLPAFSTTTLVEGGWSDGASLPQRVKSRWNKQERLLAPGATKPAATAA